MTMILYVPSRLYFGPNHWLEIGPFAVQASRLLLYAAYFFIGAGVGAANFGKGLLSPEGRLANSGWGWTVAAFIPYCLLWALIYIKREILGNPDVLPDWYEASYGIFFTAFSAAILFAILAYFLRFKQAGRKSWIRYSVMLTAFSWCTMPLRCGFSIGCLSSI
jgi:ABC-type Fe3+-siderophore transport system permease subunit